MKLYFYVNLEGYQDCLKDLGFNDSKQVPIVDQMLLNEEGKCAISTFNIVKSNEVLYTNLNNILT